MSKKKQPSVLKMAMMAMKFSIQSSHKVTKGLGALIALIAFVHMLLIASSVNSEGVLDYLLTIAMSRLAPN